MLGRKHSMVLLLLAMLMFSMMLMLLPAARAEDGVVARIWTDKTDYFSGETVIIYGSGFNPEASVNIAVTRPDATVDEWAVTSDSSGSFTTTYVLNGITGTYTVTATDGTNTATTTFTDAVKIETYKDSGFTIKENVFSRGDTVYASATGLDTSKPYKIQWFNPFGASVRTTTYVAGATYHNESYTLPSDATGGEWKVQVFEWKATPSPGSWTLKDTAPFYVFPYLSFVSITASPTTIFLPSGTPTTTTVSVTVTASVAYEIQYGATNTYIEVREAGTTTPVADLTITRTDATGVVTVNTYPYTYTLTFTVTTTAATTYTGAVDVYARVDSRTPIPPGTPGPWLSHTTTASNVFTISTPPAAVSAISVTKTANATLAHAEDVIGYSITVTNTGYNPLSKVNVTDNVLGTLWSMGSLSVGESNTFTPTWIASGEWVNNTVTAEGVDAIGGYVSATDEWSVEVIYPAIEVTKTANATLVHYCDWVEYTVTVENTGDCPLNVVLSDPLLGISWTGTLGPGESHIETVVFHPEADPTINTASAEGTDPIGGTVSDEDSWTVDILYPAIDVIKTANATMIHECDWVEYNVTVVNIGDCPLSVVLSDPLLSISWSGTLAPGAKHEVIKTFHPTSDPTVNTASATGTDALGGTVSDSDTWTVDILHPAIDVIKSGPLYAHEGDTITYTITVTNTGDCMLYKVNVTDTLLGTIWSLGTLDVGESKTFNPTYDVPVPSDDISNTVTAEGEDALGLKKTDSASWYVDVLHPAIEVTKTGPDYAHEGDTITYTITVNNTGDCPLYDVEVIDDALGNLTGHLPDRTLDVDEANTFTVDYTVPEPSEDITNTITASGKDILYKEVTDEDSWTVDILHPAIEVTKSGPDYAHEGDEITYTITVENTGDCPLYNVVVEDDLLGVLYSDGLVVGEKKTFTTTYEVPIPSGDITNTVTASGEDILDLKVEDEASWTVDVLHPAIAVMKNADKDKAYAGDTITYTITVENIGDCPLSDVMVEDDLLGVLYSDGLTVGEKKTFTQTYTVKVGDPDPLVNTVTASGEDALGLEVTDEASWSVDLIAKICGYKFYDANASGVWDGGEPAVEGFKIELWLGGAKIAETTTNSDGKYCFDELNAGTYTVKEVLPNNWINTTTIELTVIIESGEISEDHNFGNVCLKPGVGGKTLGFWANKNGQALITSSDVTTLNALNLFTPPGWAYPPFSAVLGTAKAQIKTYLLSATATDMRWMLSAQLIATKLNFLHGFLDGSTIVYVGPSSYVPSGFISINNMMANANTALLLPHPANRVEQEFWKNLLDGVNNNKFKFVCPAPCYPLVYP